MFTCSQTGIRKRRMVSRRRPHRDRQYGPKDNEKSRAGAPPQHCRGHGLRERWCTKHDSESARVHSGGKMEECLAQLRTWCACGLVERRECPIPQRAAAVSGGRGSWFCCFTVPREDLKERRAAQVAATPGERLCRCVTRLVTSRREAKSSARSRYKGGAHSQQGL